MSKLFPIIYPIHLHSTMPKGALECLPRVKPPGQVLLCTGSNNLPWDRSCSPHTSSLINLFLGFGASSFSFKYIGNLEDGRKVMPVSFNRNSFSQAPWNLTLWMSAVKCFDLGKHSLCAQEWFVKVSMVAECRWNVAPSLTAHFRLY